MAVAANIIRMWKGAVEPYAAAVSTTVTNELQYSGTLDSWTKTNVTVEDNAYTYGNIKLARITDDGTAGYHQVSVVNQYDATVGSDYRWVSAYVKAGTCDYIGLTTRAPNAANTQWNSIFNAATGAWELIGGLDDQALTGFVEDLGDGLYRIGVYNATASIAYDNVYINVIPSGTRAGQNYTGTGDTIYVGSCQVEQSPDFVFPATTEPSLYVDNPTTDSTKTRTFGNNVYYMYKGAVQPTSITSALFYGDFTEEEWYQRRRKLWRRARTPSGFDY